MTFKVGDKVIVTGDTEETGHFFKVDTIAKIKEYHDESLYTVVNDDNLEQIVGIRDLKLYQEEVVDIAPKETQPHGGPSSYYDMPFKDWVTVNDQMEYLAENKWGKYGIHLKDIFKGICRWGEKSGTTTEYDTRKIIYYGLRIYRMLVGKSGVQQYLTELMNNPQFKDTK